MDGELRVVSMTSPRGTGIVVVMNTPGAHAFAYEACDIPPDMTIADLRARRSAARVGRASVLRRLPRSLQMLRTRL